MSSGHLTQLLILLFLLVLAALLRLPQATDSLWLDEQHTAWTIRNGVEDIPHRARMGNNRPLYFTMVWLSAKLVGWNEFGMRLPSLVAGITLPVLLYGVAFRWTRSVSASFTAGLIATMDPNFLFYSLEARPYAVVQWLSVVQLAIFIAWCAGPRTWSLCLGWSLISVVMFCLHFTTILLPVAESIVLGLIWAMNRQPKIPSLHTPGDIGPFPTGQVVTAALLVGAACAWSGVQLGDLFTRRDAWQAFVPMPSAMDLFTVFPIGVCCGLPFVLVTFANVIMRWRTPGSLDPSDRSQRFRQWTLAILAMLFFTGLGLAWSLSRLDIVPIFYRRYLIAFSAIPILFCAVVLASIGNRRARCVVATIVTVATLFLIGPLHEWQQHGRFVQRSREDWRGAIAFLGNATPFPVLIDSGLIESDRLYGDEAHDPEFRSYCCLPLQGLYDMPEWATHQTPLPRSRPWEYFAREIEPGFASKAWLVVRGEATTLPHGWRMEEERQFGSVHVWLIAKEETDHSE